MVAVTPGLISEREWKGPKIQKSLFEIAWGLV